MPFLIKAALRRRAFLLVSSFLALSLGVSAVNAQQSVSSDQLPPIEVTKPGDENRTRAQPTNDSVSTIRRVVPNLAQNGTPAGVSAGNGDRASSIGGRQFVGITGASTTIITALDIAHSPAQTLAESIAAQTPGAQLTTL